jgi:hypothetical protein
MQDQLKKTAPLVVNRGHLEIGFRSIWKMKNMYPIGATGFTRKECAKIQARYPLTLLSKMGINRTMARTMHVFDLEMEQAVQHTKLMVSHT